MHYIKNILIACSILIGALAHAESPLPISNYLWDEVKALSGVSDFKNTEAKAKLYVFFDPNCHICAQLFNQNNDVDGKLQIQSVIQNGHSLVTPSAIWIPVYYMKPSSRDMAAAILRSQNFTSVSDNFQKFNFEKHLGFTAEVVPTTREINSLNQAKQVWSKLGGGTPMFVYQDRQGKYFKFIGIPPNSQLKEIFDQIGD